jgi:hypothetical protein
VYVRAEGLDRGPLPGVQRSLSGVRKLSSVRCWRPITSPRTTSVRTFQKRCPLPRWISSTPRWSGRSFHAYGPTWRETISRHGALSPSSRRAAQRRGC